MLICANNITFKLPYRWANDIEANLNVVLLVQRRKRSLSTLFFSYNGKGRVINFYMLNSNEIKKKDK